MHVVTAGHRRVVGNLPAEVTSFVGRHKEFAQVERLLASARLVTLTGVGGVGKSRLALRVAARRRRAFRDGVWLVELAAVQEPDMVAHTVAEALRIGEQSGREPLEMIGDFLCDRQLLMILDNCEHLPEACAILTDTLLHAAPELRILATSRQSLGVAGEHLWLVAPLPAADPDRPNGHGGNGNSTAVELFADRAVAASTGFAMTPQNQHDIARLCHRLDGIPLGIELAAVWLRTLSLDQLMARLDDRFGMLTGGSRAVAPRHQTLRAAVRWSYELFSARERALWTRASVFAGRFDLEAAEGVCAGDGLGVGEVLEALAGLIDKSVLVSGERDGVRRYWMLDTLRAYGLERLGNPDAGDRDVVEESELRRRHRDYYLGLAERFDADWFGPRQVAWSRRMRAELPELRAALAFCLATPGEAPAAVRLAATLSFFWHHCGVAREGSLWLERALAADPSPTIDRARALVAYTRSLTVRSLHAEAAAPARECLELARNLNDPALLADAVTGYGLNLMHLGDLAAALPMLEEGIERAAALPDAPVSLALAMLCRAGAALVDGDPMRADVLATRTRDLCRAHGDQCCLNNALSVSMLAALMLGDVARATGYGRESLPGSAAIGDTNGLTLTLEFLAWTAAVDSDHCRAARLFGTADQQARANGGNPTTAGVFAAAHDQYQVTARAALGDARFDAEFSTGAQLALDEAIAYAQGDDPTQQPQRAPTAPPPGDEQPQLTKRERQVAELVAEGRPNKQIAAQLVISQRTAESHVEHILTKLGYTSRAQIATWITAQR